MDGFLELEKYCSNLEKKVASTKTKMFKSAAKVLLARLADNTTVRKASRTKSIPSGTLRRGWSLSNSYSSKDSLVLYNPVFYGWYVNDGHRTNAKKPGKKKWVEGHYFAEKSFKEAEAEIEEAINLELIKGIEL